ncbi:glycosyltransferase family 2 protein [Pseudobacter ginsenosidimutans]|uniref:GT2 family glycosyltransferase n=1 Tax=Pseudobacter ginsenosidimutans TaxID=661488 RepID=A0A4Q7MG09_9BACT|nr:glycosyltransferase [Pseudobacter ginsenosidimutans]QEC45646.1 glycosyltransferase [Pseudobacter ginsenosidimutans]RZS67195.1 GT2 family glycosyltransferase [Pseudobacter ginsenosidimutans]
MNHSTRFSILIPTWNNLAYLRCCVESIRKNSIIPHEIIVHVNDGSDGTLEWVKQQPDIKFNHSDTNIGICLAMNLARPLATADYILYINDDMYTCPGWDTELMKEIQQIGHKNFLLSGTLIEPDSHNVCTISKDYGKDISSFREEELLRTFKDLPMKDWQGTTWPPNIMHKDLWDMIGGYSIEFSPGFYSDPDLCMKLWLLGVRIFKGVAASRVYHFGTKSTGRVVANNGYRTFLRKWGITPSTFTEYYLKRGKAYDGLLTEPQIPGKVKFKNFIKKLGQLS